MSSKPIVGLDLIRIFAAFIVILYHLAFLGWVSLGDPTGKLDIDTLSAVSRFGWVGVYIFFTLSGFVIAYSAGTDHFAFFRSRFLRLVPAAWICATITAAAMLWVGLFGAAEIAARYVSALLFSPFGPWIDDVYWTLPIEIAFYASVWLALRFGLIDRLALLLTVIGLGSSAFWYVSLLVGVPYGFISWRLMVLTLAPHGCFFAVGGLPEGPGDLASSRFQAGPSARTSDLPALSAAFLCRRRGDGDTDVQGCVGIGRAYPDHSRPGCGQPLARRAAGKGSSADARPGALGYREPAFTER